MCPMSLTFLQKAGPSCGHGPHSLPGRAQIQAGHPLLQLVLVELVLMLFGSHQEKNFVGSPETKTLG